MNRIVLTLILSLVLSTAYALDKVKVQEIEVALQQTSDQEQRCDLLLDLASLYGVYHGDLAYRKTMEARALALALGNQRLLARSNVFLGALLRNRGSDRAAVDELLLKAIDIARNQGLKELECDALIQLAICREWELDFSSADSLLHVAYNHFPKLNDPKSKARVLRRFGRVQMRAGNIEAAKECYLRSEKISRECDDRMGVSHIRREFANMQDDNETAFSMLEECIKIAEEAQNDYYIFNYYIDYGFKLYMYKPANNFEQERYNRVFSRCEELNEQNTCKLLRIKYYRMRSKFERTMGNREVYKECNEKARKIAHELRSAQYIIECTLSISTALRHTGNSDESLKELLSIEALVELTEYRADILYLNLSRSYKSAGDLHSAILYGRKALKIKEKYNDVNGIAGTQIALAHVYRDIEDYKTALQLLDSALLNPRAIKYEKERIEAWAAKGYINVLLKDYAAAADNLNTVFQLIKDSKSQIDPQYVSYAHSLGAMLYAESEQYEKSIEHALASEKINVELSWSEALLESYNYLFEGYEKLGKNKEAFQYLKKYSILRDSVFTQQQQDNFMRLTEEFNAEKKQREIESLMKEKAYVRQLLIANSASLQQSTRLLWLTVILALFMLFFGWVLFTRFKLRKKARELFLENEQFKLKQEYQKVTQQAEMAELRSTFFANVSHEIRTPLSLIKGPLEQLEKNPNSLSPELIEIVLSSSDRLMKLVDQTITVAKDNDAELPFSCKVAQYHQLLHEIAQPFVVAAKQSEVVMELDLAPHSLEYWLDFERIERILANLLSNALKHTEAGGIIRLEAKVMQRENKPSTLEFSILDNGTGIEEKHLPYIFDRYYQAGGRSSEGFGVGLSIVKRMIDQLEGEISVESTVGKGTSFHVRIPIRFAEKTEVEAEEYIYLEGIDSVEALKSSNQKAKHLNSILIVEDNHELLHFLSQQLSKFYNVFTATDGEQGLRLANEARPDIILSDIAMPRKDGYEFVQELKSNFETSHIPVILLTAKVAQQEKLRGLSYGADDYILKPFSPAELMLRIRNQLQQLDRIREWFQNSPNKLIAEAPKLNPIDVKFLEKATAAVEQNLDNEEFSVEQFCIEVALNRSSVHQKLKALTGGNTSTFIKRIRIEKAVQLIEKQEHSISEIATLTGFSNRKTFLRAFREQRGMSPSSYKEMIALQR